MTRTLFATIALALAASAPAADPWVVYQGGNGPGKGKHIVLVSGDEEYRSEEALPQLGKILAKHHGFRCTVLFAIDRKDGTINPNQNDNIPGLESLKTADLMVIFTRFRNLPDDQLKHVVDYIESGKPVVGIRTATHAFNLKKESAYASTWSWNANTKGHDGGFGRQILGETWISHHGGHGRQSTRGVIAPGADSHPIVRGIKEGTIWGPTDVYGVRLPLPGDSKPIVLGQILEGMAMGDKPITGPKNDPMMPIAWTKTYTAKGKSPARVFTSTIGASQDLVAEGTRRLMINACYWTLGHEEAIKEDMSVAIVGEFKPSPFRNNGFVKGLTPDKLAMTD